MEGVSTNGHTKPYILWVQDGEILVAAKSTHGIMSMTLDGNPSTGTSYELPIMSPLSVDNYVNLNPSATLTGNVANSRWEIFSFPLSILDASGAYTINIVSDVGGGHNVDNVIFNVVIPTATANLTKTWIDGPMTSVDIQLYRQVSGGTLQPVGTPITLTPNENHQATYNWSDLPLINASAQKYTYSIREADPGQGYVVDFESSYNEATRTYTFTLTNTYSAPKGPITAHKKWVGGPKPAVTFELYRKVGLTGIGAKVDTVVLDGVIDDKELSAWNYTWPSLPLKTDGGQDYIYYVVEPSVPANYAKLESGLTVTNTYLSPVIDILGTKTWIGGGEFNPEAVFTLLANGQPARHLGEYVDNVFVPGALVDPVTLGFEDTEIKFTNLPKTTLDGVDIVYTIEEADLEGFEVINEGYDFTNRFVIEPIDIMGTKTWIGGGEFNPEAVFTLLADGQPARHLGEYVDNVYVPGALVEAVTLGFTDTEIKFSNLPKTTVDGVEIVYTMVEAPVVDFETTQDGFNFINEFVGEVASDKVFKVEFEKSANKTTYTKLDEVIKYTFTLKNTGELDYTNVEIYDDTLNRVVLKVDVLKPQETVTETIEYKVTQADIDRKFITNVATVTGECTDCLTDPTPIVDSVTVNYKPELPDTGDNSRMISLIGTLFILGGALVLKRRKED